MACSAGGHADLLDNNMGSHWPTYHQLIPISYHQQVEYFVEGIISFLRDGIMPSGEKEAESLKKKAICFIWHVATSTRNQTLTLLNCVTSFEGNYIFRERHEGVFKRHQGERTMAGKTLRDGCWPNLKYNTTKLLTKCLSWQLHRGIPGTLANPLTTSQVILPFDKWGWILLRPFLAA